MAYDTRERDKEALLKKRQRDDESSENSKRVKTEDEHKDKDVVNGTDNKDHPDEGPSQLIKREEDKPTIKVTYHLNT